MKRIYFFLVTLLFLPMSLLQAAELLEQINGDALLSLVKEKDVSILECTEERVYFNPNRLLFSIDGMFIQTDSGALCPISNVSFDANVGYYQEPPTTWVTCRNPNCRYRFDNKYSYCPRCGTAR